MRYSIKGSAMTVTLPVPTLDHVVVNVRDRIDAGLATYRRLGFTMTPRGYHTLGSMNHLAIFGTEYLELIAAPSGDTRRGEILAAPFGLNGLVFGTEDSASVYAALHEADVPVEPPLEFSRPVELTGGPRNATFRTVRLTPGSVAVGRIYFCHHFTRDLVWRDEWRHHPNGAVGVARAVIAAHDPSALGRFFIRMFGEDSVRQSATGCSLAVGLSRFDIVTPAGLAHEFGDAAPAGDGRDEYMAALTIRVRSLDGAAAALAAGQIPGVYRGPDRIVVPATEAFGVTIEFRA
jgi:catechol 2,3-dioxygenase-like lactoylglutathione lyase family enzyme